MPLLALNRKDTGGYPIGSKAPRIVNKPADQAADSAGAPRKRFQCGGIVAGAGITGFACFLTRFLHPWRHPNQARGRLSRENAMMSSRNGYIAS
jgi:hypothetical protein